MTVGGSFGWKHLVDHKNFPPPWHTYQQLMRHEIEYAAADVACIPPMLAAIARRASANQSIQQRPWSEIDVSFATTSAGAQGCFYVDAAILDANNHVHPIGGTASEHNRS